jgi:hypothetical protein
MKRSAYVDDPIAYRIAYSQVAQKLHLASIPEGHRHPILESLGLKLRQEGEPPEPPEPVTNAVTGLVGSQSPPHQLGEIETEALKLIADTRAELVELGMSTVGWNWGKVQTKRRFRDPLRLVEFLDQILEPATVVLYFSARIQNGHREQWLLDPPQPELPPERKDGDLGEMGVGDGKGSGFLWLRDYLGSLCNGGAKKEPRWFGFQRKNTEPINYRVRYNLACLYARYGAPQEPPGSSEGLEADDQALNMALGHLGAAIIYAHGRERKALTAWAVADPALRPLREGEWLARFEIALLAAGDDAKAI